MLKKNTPTDSLTTTINLLKKYMLTIPNPQRGKFRRRLAMALGVSEDYLRAIECGIKQLQPWMADTIEKHTNGSIKSIQIYRAYSIWQKQNRTANTVKIMRKTHTGKTNNQHVQ